MKYTLTVAGKNVGFRVNEGEDFDAALSRGAKKLGYHGGGFAQPNLQTDHQVTVCDRPSEPRISNARQCYNGTVVEMAAKRGRPPMEFPPQRRGIRVTAAGWAWLESRRIAAGHTSIGKWADALGRRATPQRKPNAEVSDGGPLTHESTETRTRRSLH